MASHQPYNLREKGNHMKYMEEELDKHWGEDEIGARCYHCNTVCFGLCDNEDRCYTCFTHDKSDPYISEEEWIRQLDTCLDDKCTCVCHISVQEEKNKMMLSRDGEKWVKIPRRKPTRAFKFMSLPPEIRCRVYHYLFLPEIPDQRVNSMYHKGAIHKSILFANRHIYEEAKTYPLRQNKLAFQTPGHGCDFFKLQLQPVLANFITDITVELHAECEPDQQDFRSLCDMLASTNVERLSLIIRGDVDEGQLEPGQVVDETASDFDPNCCDEEEGDEHDLDWYFIRGLRYVTKLKDLDVEITSRSFSKKHKSRIEKRLQERYELVEEEEEEAVDPCVEIWESLFARMML